MKKLLIAYRIGLITYIIFYFLPSGSNMLGIHSRSSMIRYILQNPNSFGLTDNILAFMSIITLYLHLFFLVISFFDIKRHWIVFLLI
jgi:hypothetical protein